MIMQNIVLSGGSTMFQHFGQHLKRDLKQLVDRSSPLEGYPATSQDLSNNQTCAINGIDGTTNLRLG
jgi:actin-related protein